MIHIDEEICDFCDRRLGETASILRRHGRTLLFCNDRHCKANWLDEQRQSRESVPTGSEGIEDPRMIVNGD